MPDTSINFMVRAKKWTKENNLHGPHAFLRFVMFIFVERLNSVSDEFIFKGGNLLWLYIKTPRSTVDVDFATKSIKEHDLVREALQKVCGQPHKDIAFSIQSFRKVAHKGGLGAAVTIAYKTSEGQQNAFDLDIVYAIPTVTARVAASVDTESKILVSTVENIIVDKLATCQKFKGGNTRMKDFDDLWRMAESKVHVDKDALKLLLKSRDTPATIDLNWINPLMEKSWQAHVRRNDALPDKLDEVFNRVNAWLKKYTK